MIYECTRIVGHETFKVGFASKEKANKWLEENIEHYIKLKNMNKLFKDVTLRVDCEEDKLQTRGMFITRCKKTFVNLELSVHDLYTIKDALSRRLTELKANNLYVDWIYGEEIEVETLLNVIEKEINNYD